MSIQSPSATPALDGPSLRLARGWLALALLLAVMSVGLMYGNRATVVPATWSAEAGVYSRGLGWLWDRLFYLGVLSVFLAALGLRIVARFPRHAMGWFFCGGGLVAATLYFVQEYTVYANFTRPGLVGGAGAAWMMSWLWAPASTLPSWAALIFPDGRLPRGQRRWICAPLVGFLIGVVSGEMLRQPMGSAYGLPNPLPVVGLQPLADFLFNAGRLCGPLAFGATVVWVGWRFRGARGDERQQFKWVLSAATLTLALNLLGQVLDRAGALVGQWLVEIAPVFLIAGITIAILRFRLYDIDLLIRRTLVYTMVSGALALVYFGSVVVLQGLFRATAGQGSDLAIVASTLAIAALFNPLRRRIQTFIDRRFYRQGYDAHQTLATFAAALRADSNADLDHLTGELLATIQETMQPAHLSVWLKPDDGRPP